MTMVSPDTQTLERAVRGYVAAGSGLSSNRVIEGNGDGSAPNELFASVLLITAEARGVPWTLYREGEGDMLDAPTIGTVRARYSVQWHRRGARDAARRFSLWLWSPEGMERAATAGLTIARASDVRQLDAIIADAWEERAGLDLDIGYLESVSQQVGAIGSVPIAVGSDEEFVITGGLSNDTSA